MLDIYLLRYTCEMVRKMQNDGDGCSASTLHNVLPKHQAASPPPALPEGRWPPRASSPARNPFWHRFSAISLKRKNAAVENRIRQLLERAIAVVFWGYKMKRLRFALLIMIYVMDRLNNTNVKSVWLIGLFNEPSHMLQAMRWGDQIVCLGQWHDAHL